MVGRFHKAGIISVSGLLSQLLSFGNTRLATTDNMQSHSGRITLRYRGTDEVRHIQPIQFLEAI